MPMQIQVEMGVPSRVASPKASRWFPAYHERGNAPEMKSPPAPALSPTVERQRQGALSGAEGSRRATHLKPREGA